MLYMLFIIYRGKLLDYQAERMIKNVERVKDQHVLPRTCSYQQSAPLGCDSCQLQYCHQEIVSQLIRRDTYQYFKVRRYDWLRSLL